MSIIGDDDLHPNLRVPFILHKIFVFASIEVPSSEDKYIACIDVSHSRGI